MSTEAGHDHPNIPSKEETVPEHQHNHRSYGPSDRRGHDLSGRYSMDHRRRRGDGSPEIATVVESSVVTFTQEQNCNSSSVDCLPPAGPEITSFITTPIAATSTAAPFTIFVSAFALSDCVLSGLGCGPDSTGDISISTPIPSLSTSTPSSQSRYIIPPVLTPISATTTSPSADRTHPVSPSSISLLTPLPTSSSNATTTSSSGDGDGERSIISTTNTQPTFLASRGTSVSSHALNLNHATPISSSGEKAASRSTAPFISPSGILSPTVSLSTPTFTPTTSTSPSSTSSGFIGPHSNPTFPTPLSIPPQSASKLSSWPPGGESTSTTQPSAGSSGVSDSGSSQRESKGHSRSLVIALPILGVAFIISVLVFVFYFEKRRRAAIVHTTRAMHHDIGEMYYDFEQEPDPFLPAPPSPAMHRGVPFGSTSQSIRAPSLYSAPGSGSSGSMTGRGYLQRASYHSESSILIGSSTRPARVDLPYTKDEYDFPAEKTPSPINAALSSSAHRLPPLLPFLHGPPPPRIRTSMGPQISDGVEQGPRSARSRSPVTPLPEYSRRTRSGTQAELGAVVRNRDSRDSVGTPPSYHTREG